AENQFHNWAITRDFSAEFSLKAVDYTEGIQLVENAKRKLVSSNSCWQRAYQQIFAACSEIIGDDSEKRKRFAWDLCNCFQNDSGRPYFPHCQQESSMQKCLAKLDDISYQTYLQFFLETNTICYQLQATAFRLQTEKLVNDLKNTAHIAEEKMDNMEMKTEQLLQSSNNILSSLNTIDQHSQQVAETTKNVSDHMDIVVEHSMAVFKQSQQIAAFQSELKTGQEQMKSNLEEGMATLNHSYKDLGDRLDDIKDETVEVEKKINEVGDAMSEKMTTLQSRADDIGKMTGISLEKQKQLLDKQSTALEGLQAITEFQSQALAESRASLKELAEFGHTQQEMLLQRQQQLEQAHEHLVENSKSILAAQEAFEFKQAHMFAALDKLFSLHNAMLVESRLIKAFFLYCLSIFVLYVLTSTKQTYTVRPRLYIGLCASFMIEMAILRCSMNDIEQQTWLLNLVRLLYTILASIQLLFAIYSYRDYEMLNHQMLLTLIEKVNSIRKNSDLSWETDSDVDWSSWIDTEFPDDVDNLKDPDYMPPVPAEESKENSFETSPISRKYDLRPRHGCRSFL
ncbi:protein GAMETE EXPRESSED 1-like, partial [Durio zibethinus]|uniref:Protein GAMETE EXPRESSED 1-like n=1 Tax=Durio zibethinus TaxID=66656 RepID=A0A6P6A525_DURZI